MNTTSSSTVVYLNFIARELNRYIPLTLLVLGSIGNIINLLVFSRPSLRTSPCSLYFISASIANFISLYVGLLTPFLALYNLDPTQKSTLLCKLRIYIRFVTITLSTWFILFACINRFLSSSKYIHYRSWSSIDRTKRTIFLSTITVIACPYTHLFYCYSINEKRICTFLSNSCKSITDGILILCNSGVPPVLMLLFSLFTIRNVKHFTGHHIHNRRHVQITRILFIQVLILVLFSIPITGQKLYSFIDIFQSESFMTTAINNLINQVTIEISYVNNSITFYVYSLTSRKFRAAVRQLLSSDLARSWKRTNLIRAIQ
jgi:hypothetical protein